MAHKGAEVAAEFKMILDHPGILVNSPSGAIAHLELASAYGFSGNKNQAKTAYREFLTLWKDADPGIPILKQAKTEYATLQ
jgi:eukaryotic-like serine/threonine-protein kinase